MSLVSVSHSQSMEPKYHTQFRTVSVPKLTDYSDIMATRIWSPIIWELGQRLRDNFLSCKYAALDFDTGEWTLKMAEAWCLEQKLSAIIGTSKSHQKVKTTKSGVVQPAVDRFRLIVPFAEVITAKHVYEYNMRQIARRIPCDGSCVDAARYFFPCKEIIFTNLVPGSGLAVLPAPSVDQEATTRRKIESMRILQKTGVFPSWMIAALRFGVDVGGRNHTCYRIGANLYHAGYLPEEIVNLIMRSPLSAIGIDMVTRAVQNGFNKAEQEL